jgi:hypothetical protein
MAVLLAVKRVALWAEQKVAQMVYQMVGNSESSKVGLLAGAMGELKVDWKGEWTAALTAEKMVQPSETLTAENSGKK